MHFARAVRAAKEGGRSRQRGRDDDKRVKVKRRMKTSATHIAFCAMKWRVD